MLRHMFQSRSFLAATTVTDPATQHTYSLFGGGEIEAGGFHSNAVLFGFTFAVKRCDWDGFSQS